jgi:hypothetical protein
LKIKEYIKTEEGKMFRPEIKHMNQQNKMVDWMQNKNLF